MAMLPHVQWLVEPHDQLIQVGLQLTLDMRSMLTPEQLAEGAQLTSWGLVLHAETRRFCTVEP
jgi:hypothetical protein